MHHTLTIIIPCFNEQQFISGVLDKVLRSQLPGDIQKEVIVVDDYSSDGSVMAIESYLSDNPGAAVTLVKHSKNQGKGASIHSGIARSTGDMIIIQDADYEYDPAEYGKLLRPILDGHADVVYGSRFRGSEAHRVLFFLHSAGNKMLTTLSNLFTGMNLTDMETGYKLFNGPMLRSLKLKEKRFGFEPEVTARIARISGIRVYEVGISYYGRSYAEGKKIGWKDGVRALYCIIKYNIFSR
ncbi:MAG: glycosyltransferase family 2 protein [Chitinophagaceae bacterium]